MSKFFSEKRKETISFLIFVFIFIIFYIINKGTPIWSDDWAFYFAYGEKRVEHFSAVLSSVANFYFGLNGRSVANFIIELFVLAGKNIFNIINAGMFVFLVFLVYILSNDDKKSKPIGLMGIFILLWFFLPAANQTLFWMCGSIVYLWMTVLGLAFLWPFKKIIIENEKLFLKNKFIFISLMFILGLFAGNSHELLAPIIFLISFLASIIFWRRKKILLHWSNAGVLGVFLGIIIQMVAPGNVAKFNSGAQNGNFLEHIFAQLGKIIPNVWELQHELWIIVGLILCIYLLNKLFFRNKELTIDGTMLVALSGAIMLDVLSVFFPYFPPRAYFFSSIFLIVSISRFLFAKDFWKVKFVLVLCFIPALILSVKTTMTESKELSIAYAKREASIADQKAQGKRDIVVDKIGRIKNEKLLGDTLSRRNHLGASRFYGIDSIRIK